MTLGVNLFVYICTVVIVGQNIDMSRAFLIPPYHYYGFMGGSYFPCNWGYSYCSYVPQDYYYDNGCECPYQMSGCVPCAVDSPSGLQVPSYPEQPYFPGFIIPGLPGIPESPGVTASSVTTEENGGHGLDEVTAADENNEEDYTDDNDDEEDDEDYDDDDRDFGTDGGH
jgi:hypothetical protein